MGKTVSRLTVLFENPFWVGVYERECGGKYEACKITFGAEPKDSDIYGFLLRHQAELKFSPSLEGSARTEKRVSPKRMQREVHRQLQNTGMGTKAQQALKLQHEQGKSERKSRARAERENEQERRFRLRQNKQKEKHRGH